MASKFLSNDQQNFTRMGVVCVDEISLVFRDVLESQITPKDLYSKISSCWELTNGSHKHKLRPEQKNVCFLPPPSVPDYSKFDVSLLYKLIRNMCHCLKPSQGWAKKPDIKDIQIGDDIERLRLFRNEMFGHLHSSDISDYEFSSQWKELKDILQRVQKFVRSQGQRSACDYEEDLAVIKKIEYGFKDMDKYKILLEGILHFYKQTEDFPTITIRGESRILCGNKAIFVAEIDNCFESSNLIVTWIKTKGTTTDHLDTNSKKFKDSTPLRLVIQRVLKEDEGDYQAVVLREVNGRHLNLLSNKISLKVYGDPPIMEILDVTSDKDYLAIHYSCFEDVLPMIDQIQWTKNGKVLEMNSTKYIGGGVKDKYLKILSPTEEDDGEYVCKVFNALDSVSRSIKLGIPTAELPNCLKIPFGSQVTIKPDKLSSCPPVLKVDWQMSIDQKSENFKSVDVTHSRYYGSTSEPQNPSLVIPKVSNADRMYYRIHVSNGIWNSWSNATLLQIDGDIPSVFLNHETNILERKVSIVCRVVLAKNSPKVESVLWTKDNKPLDISGCGEKYLGGDLSHPTLIINGLNSNDCGKYQCNVSNAVGNMSSRPICLDSPCIRVENSSLENDGEVVRFVCRCTVESIPEATAVEWSIQQRPEDSFRTIDVHEPTYKGTTVALPYPVLIVHKYTPTSLLCFRIKVTNFIGETTQVIQGEMHRKGDPCPFQDSEEFDARMDFYRKGGLKSLFATLAHNLAELFPEGKLETLKFLLNEIVEQDTGTSIMEAKSMRHILQILRQKKIFCPKDVLFVQCLLKKIECHECTELYNKCFHYAMKCKALCFFEKQPENGFKQVRIHVNGNLDDYSKEDLLSIRDMIVTLLECSPEFVLIEGLCRSESFVVILAIKKEYVNKLLELAQILLELLCDLNVDYLECDGLKISRQAVVKVPARKKDSFGNMVKYLMIETEDYMKKTQKQHNYKLDDKVISNLPYWKGNDEYKQWLQDDLFKAIAKLSDTFLSRSLHTVGECLLIYNEGLIINSLARSIDALNFMYKNFEDLPEPSLKTTPLEDDVKNLYRSKKVDLETYARDEMESEENPLLLKLEDIILDTHKKEPELKGIIFVSTQSVADCLICWINESEQFKDIRATTYTWSPVPETEMTKQVEDFYLIVSTSIDKECMDIKNFNLVVGYDFPGEISHFLAKGFSRNSHFYALESAQKYFDERRVIDTSTVPVTGQSHDPKTEDDQSRQRKISSKPNILGSRIDLNKSAEKSEDPLKEVQGITQLKESSLTDNYDSTVDTTSDEAINYGERLTERKGTVHDMTNCLTASNDLSKKTLTLREYQLELSEQPLKGENCMIVSPAGSGKTYVAIRLIKHFLEETAKVGKIVFIVDKNNLASQHSEKIREYIHCRLKVISGDTQREENFQEMKPLIPQYDVFVVTAQMLVNALTNQGVSIKDFSLLIFDECHHCHGSHPFKQIMNQYMDVKLEQTDEESQLPQVVGFTASVGVGKAKTIEKATEYFTQVMSNMDAHYLVTVRKNRSDLASHVISPEQFIKETPVRARDEFGERLKSLMVTTEKYLEDIGVGVVDRNALQPPSTKGSERYTQWLEDVLLKALATLYKSEACRSLFSIRKYLEIYNNALIHHSYARASDALDYIKNAIEYLPKLSRNENEIERKIKSLFEGEYIKLAECALDHERTTENPLMLKLKKIILTTHAEEPNMRVIVFVRTRILADIIASWINNSKELQHIKARKYTGSQAHNVERGMTKHEQVNAIKLFQDGEFKVIVATTITEE